MINIPEAIRARVTATYGRFFENLSRLPAEKCGHDVLNEEKVHDQIALFCRLHSLRLEDLRGKRLLEVGSGFGIFLVVLRRDYGVESFGIEPASEGFDTSFELGREIIAHYGFDPAILTDAKGEALPFPDEHFDLVFSSTVLEHTQNPALVLQEAIRVLKPTGMMQFVYPNYGSFFDGHYAVPWIPYQPRWMARIWIRVFGRDPSFVDTLQLTNYWRTRNWLRAQTNIQIITYGEQIFRERMMGLQIKDWAGLGRLRKVVELAHRLRIIGAVTKVMIAIKSFEPIILTLKKKPTDSS